MLKPTNTQGLYFSQSQTHFFLLLLKWKAMSLFHNHRLAARFSISLLVG